MSDITLGQKIKALRESLGLTQNEVANKTGYSQAFIQQVESDKTNPSLKSLKKIAAALGVDESKLVTKVYMDDEKYIDHYTQAEKQFLASQKTRPVVSVLFDINNEGLSPEKMQELLKTVMDLVESNKSQQD